MSWATLSTTGPRTKLGVYKPEPNFDCEMSNIFHKEEKSLRGKTPALARHRAIGGFFKDLYTSHLLLLPKLFGIGSVPKAMEGKHVAVGWPSWLATVVREAIKGWLPRHADSFEKLDKVEQFQIFKLCGSPSEDYWRQSKLPHATIFKPQQPYKHCVTETYELFLKGLRMVRKRWKNVWKYYGKDD
ncbi:hypothetical protein Fmac_032518 [Flemingia macrophylla]|uniref:Uncharacterized protein n=1 Tax=Flemingia macrophylla TaxID=520843 RepID=A0ABD1L566_9FABA